MEKETIKGLSHTLDLLIGTFDIALREDCSHLSEWTTVSGELNEMEKYFIEKLYNQAKLEANHWNEEELKMRLVSVLLLLAEIDEAQKIKTFFERPFKGVVDKYELSVVTDCMIASPFAINSPRTPYFFLQEYKKGRGDHKDPEAQMLAAMLIAQEKNNDDKPMLGSYIIGTDWYFTTLVGRNYCSSREYDVRNYNDLLQILFILRKLKVLIMKR
jgi:hypothetical protein